ncbi:hypothetical protein AVEN_52142-1 [Araneus ventricosus]|uniref:Uncharacterized protein n=1 Tax=Araneus ventricosus TaxID=182803 RepID=A0A4Y2PZ11_ARAVE|nr:hypothetical protein AVEN_52142-1 [Araneus ventricosus]
MTLLLSVHSSAPEGISSPPLDEQLKLTCLQGKGGPSLLFEADTTPSKNASGIFSLSLVQCIATWTCLHPTSLLLIIFLRPPGLPQKAEECRP